MNILLRCFFKKAPVLFFSCLFSLFVMRGFAQSTCNNITVNACTGGNISQNFSTNNGNFYSNSFVYSGINQRWELNSPNFFATYSINSSNFRLEMNGIARIGFVFGRTSGSCLLTTAGFTVTVINNLNNQILAQCTDVSFSSGNIVCANISDADLVAGIPVHFVLSFKMRPPCFPSTFYFDDFSVGNSASAAPVPVTLTTFTAKRKNNSVNLEWQTASEFNNRGFEIERKPEGEEGFETIGFEPAKTADGNSSDMLNYSYSDVNISANVSQYRLKQTDLDGKYKYSDILFVKGTTEAGRILIYPNPSAQGTVNVVFDSFGKKDIQLTDINGKVQLKWNDYSSGQLQVNKLRSGVYLLNVTDLINNSKTIKKIVVL
ncbi:MAG: T9SS type A sorting domain-containing protein [Bacteroidota bacterium]